MNNLFALNRPLRIFGKNESRNNRIIMDFYRKLKDSNAARVYLVKNFSLGDNQNFLRGEGIIQEREIFIIKIRISYLYRNSCIPLETLV